MGLLKLCLTGRTIGIVKTKVVSYASFISPALPPFLVYMARNMKLNINLRYQEISVELEPLVPTTAVVEGRF